MEVNKNLRSGHPIFTQIVINGKGISIGVK
jgi:hypothetical protein